MIRIDLGRKGQKQGEVVRKVVAQLKLEQPYAELLAKFDNDFSRLALFVISLAVAALPYFLEGEYERVIRRNYARKIASISSEIAAVDRGIESLKPFKLELDSYETQKGQVSQRLSVIQELLRQRGTPVVALDAVGQALPDRVWLESVSFDATNPAAEKISFQGRSFSSEDISDLADRLGQSSYLRNIRIVSVDSASANGLEVRAFSIELNAVGSRVSNGNREIGSQKER
jgi:Tfp pilus assembly protein PilN